MILTNGNCASTKSKKEPIMANIKKAFQPIVDLLEANSGSKVSTILDQVLALASAKTGGGSAGPTSFHKNDDGVVVAIRCAYHKQFFNPDVVEFGAKSSSASGFSAMSKDGTAKWNAQYKQAKEAEAQLLQRLQDGDIQVSDIAAEQERIAEERAVIVPIDGGYDTLEELLAAE
jgi:hypothetical protein